MVIKRIAISFQECTGEERVTMARRLVSYSQVIKFRLLYRYLDIALHRCKLQIASWDLWTPAKRGPMSKSDSQSSRLSYRTMNLLSERQCSIRQLFGIGAALLLGLLGLWWCTALLLLVYDETGICGMISVGVAEVPSWMDLTHSTLLCPTRSQRGKGGRARRQPSVKG